MKRIFAVAWIVLLSWVGHAQSGGSAYQQQVFANRTTAGYSAAVKNFNQASHWLFYCNTGTLANGHVQLVGSYDSNPAHGVVISTVGNFAGSSCGLIQGGGYYFAVFAQVALDSGSGMSVSAYYSGAVGPISTPSNVGLPNIPAISCSNFNYHTLTGSYLTIAGPAPAGKQIYVCSITIDGNQAATAGSVVDVHTSSFGIFLQRSLPTGASTFLWGQATGSMFTVPSGDVVQALTTEASGTVNISISYAYY